MLCTQISLHIELKSILRMVAYAIVAIFSHLWIDFVCSVAAVAAALASAASQRIYWQTNSLAKILL